MELKNICCLQGHTERVWNICWNPKGNLLASCGGDKTIRIWGQDGNDWKLKAILEDGHQRTVRCVQWSPCGRFLATASFDATTSIWSQTDGEFDCIATLEGHENEVKSAAWSSSGSLLATCSRDKSVWIWEVVDDEYECASVQSKHTQDVKKVTWHPYEDILASCSYDDTINMFKDDDDDWFCFDTLKGHTSTVWSICFDKTGGRLASCSDDKTIKIWKCYYPGNQQGIITTGNDPSWKCVCTLSGYHRRVIYDIDWSHESDLIVSCGGDDSIRIFKEEDGSKESDQPVFDMIACVEKAHEQDVNCVKWNPSDPTLLASCSDDMTVRIWKCCQNGAIEETMS